MGCTGARWRSEWRILGEHEQLNVWWQQSRMSLSDTLYSTYSMFTALLSWRRGMCKAVPIAEPAQNWITWSLLLFMYFLDPGLVCFSAWLRSNRIWVVSQCGWTLPRPSLCHHLWNSIWNIIMDNGVCDSAAKYSIKPNPIPTYSVMPDNDYHQKVPLPWLSHRQPTLPSDCTMHSPTILCSSYAWHW